jgi:hypothetical protein
MNKEELFYFIWMGDIENYDKSKTYELIQSRIKTYVNEYCPKEKFDLVTLVNQYLIYRNLRRHK